MLLSGVVLIDGLCIQQVLLSVSTVAPWFCECSVLGLFPFPRCRWYPIITVAALFLELVNSRTDRSWLLGIQAKLGFWIKVSWPFLG